MCLPASRHPPACSTPGPSPQLRLEVCSSGSLEEARQLLRLAGRAHLTAVHFQQSHEEAAAAAAVSELLSHAGWHRLAGRELRQLAGVPWSSAREKSWEAAPAPAVQLGAYPQLQRLELYAPPYQQALSLRRGDAGWEAAQQLRHLRVEGRHYLALRVLPPRLESLHASAWHVLAEPSVLVGCRRVELLATAVLLSEHVLPYGAMMPAAGAEQRLQWLAGVVAEAGLPPGHRIQLHTSLVCFQRADIEHREVQLAWRAAGEGEVLHASAGGVVASLAAPPAPRPRWPASMGPCMADGSGPQMHLVLQREAM